MRTGFIPVSHFKILLAGLVLFFVCGIYANSASDDYVLDVSVSGIKSDYDVFFRKYCEMQDGIYDLAKIEEACAESGVFTPSGGVEVSLKNTAGETVQVQTTDSAGKCQFRDIPRALYYVEVVTERFSSATGNDEKSVLWESNLSVYNGVYQDKIMLEGAFLPVEIRGSVVDKAGKKLKGVPVNLFFSISREPQSEYRALGARAMTDESGNFSIFLSNRDGDNVLHMPYSMMGGLKRTNWFASLYRVDVGNGTTQTGTSKPFFVLPEDVCNYVKYVIKNAPTTSQWNNLLARVKRTAKIKAYPNVPKSKGHIMFLPDIVLTETPQKAAK